VSHEEAHAHGSSTTSTGPVFSPEEVASLRASDVGAARSVVLLMCGVFTIGLCLYLVVAWSCWPTN